MGSAEPWVASFIEDPLASGGSFHPNAAGMAAVAAHLEKLVRPVGR
jgi:lysophospholipase L1-like esterase